MKPENLIDKFNSQFKIGDKVMLRKWSEGEYEQHVVKSEAFMSHGNPVVFFEGIRGYFSIEPEFIKY